LEKGGRFKRREGHRNAQGGDWWDSGVGGINPQIGGKGKKTRQKRWATRVKKRSPLQKREKKGGPGGSKELADTSLGWFKWPQAKVKRTNTTLQRKAHFCPCPRNIQGGRGRGENGRVGGTKLGTIDSVTFRIRKGGKWSVEGPPHQIS